MLVKIFPKTPVPALSFSDMSRMRKWSLRSLRSVIEALLIFSSFSPGIVDQNGTRTMKESDRVNYTSTPRVKQRSQFLQERATYFVPSIVNENGCARVLSQIRGNYVFKIHYCSFHCCFCRVSAFVHGGGARGHSADSLRCSPMPSETITATAAECLAGQVYPAEYQDQRSGRDDPR